MKTLFAVALCVAAVTSLPCRAQVAASPPEPAGAKEPVVKRTVIEDEGSRIEELKVRGQTQRIVVTPKVMTRQAYEIIPADGARDMSDGASSTRGAAGKRVWHVLSF
ncbi:MAG TPA: hypothetical protein VKI18_13435 [Albitalea sp.]|nr:hypothetical protein [Albitalea sp.]